MSQENWTGAAAPAFPRLAPVMPVQRAIDAEVSMLRDALKWAQAERDDALQKLAILRTEMQARIDQAINRHVQAAGNAQRGQAMLQGADKAQLAELGRLFGVD